MYSWYVSVKAKMPGVMMPGTMTGMMIRRKACKRVQPSIWALSSISFGTVRTKPIRSQVQNGRVNEGYTMTSAQIESMKPEPAHELGEREEQQRGRDQVGEEHRGGQRLGPREAACGPARRPRAERAGA